MKKSSPKTPLKAADLIAQAAGFSQSHVDKLRSAVKRGPVDFASLCDLLDLSPARTRALIEHAREQHLTIRITGERVGIGLVEPAVPTVKDTGIAPTVGERQRVGVISDLHFGSRYCMRPQIAEFVEHAYARGVREVLIPGDVLEGCYKHAQFELTHSSLEDQCNDALETLPRKEGLAYYFITGNHDETFWAKTGVNVGRYLEHHFQDAGRRDLHFVAEGDRQAYVKIRGAVIDMWHPKVNCGYAVSYGVQNRISEYAAIKPQILLIGHWHRFCYVYQRGIHGIACPTLQGAGARFGKSLRGGPSIGGLVLSWSLTKDGTIRDFDLSPRLYFERERPVEIVGQLDAHEVPPQVYDPVPRRRGAKR